MQEFVEKKIESSSFVFGIDVGIASTGWAVISESKIIDRGVRVFDKAENPQNGESLNQERRKNRLSRRQVRRKQYRLQKFLKFCVRQEILEEAILPKIFVSPWVLRVEALSRKLSNKEWVYVLYHILKHRGFHWVSKAEEVALEKDAATGGIKASIEHLKNLLKSSHSETISQAIVSEFNDKTRNKKGSYEKCISRELLANEMKLLFERQRSFANLNATNELEFFLLGKNDKKSGLLWEQKNQLSGLAILDMVGPCRFEKGEKRGAKHSFSSERHIFLTTLLNTRLIFDGKERSLTKEEFDLVKNIPLDRSSDITYENIRKVLEKNGTFGFSFKNLKYPSQKQIEDKTGKNPEKKIFSPMKGFYTLKKAMKNCSKEWDILVKDVKNGKQDDLDNIFSILTIYKTDEEIFQELNDVLSKKSIHEISHLRFDGFHSLSIKALRKILPKMENGFRYDEAVASVKEYKHHSKKESNKQKYLPELYVHENENGKSFVKINPDLEIDLGEYIPTNPVVLRSIHQAIKIINELVKSYGTPKSVHIELGRDMTKSFMERRQIDSENRKRKEIKENLKKDFLNTFGQLPTNKDFDKWMLFKEQNGICLYSGQKLIQDKLFSPGYAEIDHAIPRSRSMDNSLDNKCLVLTSENRNKGNQIVFEYLGNNENSSKWKMFEQRIFDNQNMKGNKKQNLLKKFFGKKEKEEFLSRNLNDTRYIARFLKKYVDHYLTTMDNESSLVINGRMTSFLRAKWGLTKNRLANNRHHALDALVIAACSKTLEAQISNYFKYKENIVVPQDFIDPETGATFQIDINIKDFPLPWDNFTNEVNAIVFEEKKEELAMFLKETKKYSETEIKQLFPIVVSRAVNRRSFGALHKSTIVSLNDKKDGAIEKIPLQKLNLNKLENMVDKERNSYLYNVLKKRLEQFGGKGDIAFSSDQDPIHIHKNKNSPVVSGIRCNITQKQGIYLRNGIADLGTMSCLDLYIDNNGKFIAAPKYQVQKNKIRATQEKDSSNSKYLMSLWKNEFLEIEANGKIYRGYFTGYESDGRIGLVSHDEVSKDAKIFRGSLANVKSIQKLHVSILGKVYK